MFGGDRRSCLEEIFDHRGRKGDMKILFIHSLMFHGHTWQRVARRLREVGIRLELVPQTAAETALDAAKGEIDLLIVDYATAMPADGGLPAGWEAIAHRLCLSPDLPASAAAEFTTFDTGTAAEFKQYVAAVSLDNYCNGIRFLTSQMGLDLDFAPPAAVVTTGIYHPHAPTVFEDVAAYQRWRAGRLPGRQPVWVGLLCYYSQVTEGNTADLDALILRLEAHFLTPVCLFCEGAEDGASATKDPQWLKVFRCLQDLEVILSFMGGRLLKTNQQVTRLETLDVPIIQMLRAHTQTPGQWEADPRGLPAISAVYSLAQPETFGAIAPVMVAGSEAQGKSSAPIGPRRFIPIDARIETLCRRIWRWIRLRQMAQWDKQITFVLHNAPCKGVEATVGAAVGLDTFASLARVLEAMRADGYDVGDAPAEGGDILATIMDRKAMSEFRWTTVDEIVAKGGVLHRVRADSYEPWFNQLPAAARNKVLADWGPFPGEGMTADDQGEAVLLITGIQYGKVRIMVQPKRGCYGPKCTGEVCRILHDPELAPPHHWLATYRYIQENSDAVVHVGTEGALEFLPGKQNALSGACFPEISIGDLPNLYLYVMDATGEGITAKRRGQAVLVDHLTPVYRSAPLDEAMRRLEPLLEEHQRAVEMAEGARQAKIAQKIAPLLVTCGLADTPPSEEALPALIDTARRRIAAIRRALMPDGLHCLSVPPDATGKSRMLAHLLRTPPPGLPSLEEIAGWSSEERTADASDEVATRVIKALLTGEALKHESSETKALARFCREVAERLDGCKAEINQLLHGLRGGFIAPGLSGSLSRGKVDALPTGRNFFATDVTTLPTPAAWEVGRRMADDLLRKYVNETAAFPESVGISIWSSDAFKSDGELLCQVLALLGVRPVWDNQGRVTEMQVLDLEELCLEFEDGDWRLRPRVDITIQTSGIMRDLVPNFCELLDRAVTQVSALDEPEARNFVRKHSQAQLLQLRDQTTEDLSEAQLQRLSTVRIFSSTPGSYGLGVGLALDASAWENADDLAEVYINWGGHAYAYTDTDLLPYGGAAQQVFADQLARIDVAYMKQASAEYDLLDCGCYAVFQGGMATAAKAVGAKTPKLYWGDSTRPTDEQVADIAETLQCAARAKLLNPTWSDHLRRHGHQGAQAVASRVNSLFKWSATSGQVPKNLFDAVVDTYLNDEDKRAWLRRENPYALEEITRRLLEAASRGLWAADQEMLEVVRSTALEIEGDMEEGMGDVAGEFQGNKVEVLTANQVDKWVLKWRLNAH